MGEYHAAIKTEGDFPGGPVVESSLPMQWAWVRSLVGELRSHMLWGMAKKKKKKKRDREGFLPWYNLQDTLSDDKSNLQNKAD